MSFSFRHRADLRREVEKLLANFAEAGNFLSGPPLQAQRQTAEVTAGFGSLVFRSPSQHQ
jgi:hypothetical protein